MEAHFTSEPDIGLTATKIVSRDFEISYDESKSYRNNERFIYDTNCAYKKIKVYANSGVAS